MGYGSGYRRLGGTYLLSNNTNGNVGSSGSPITIILARHGGGSLSPGPALTIADIGAGTMYPVNNLPSTSPTASVPLKGTYSTSSLGGTPSAIQAQLSHTAGGPAVSGFAWQNLSSQTIGGGDWSGTILDVPPGAYWVSVEQPTGPPTRRCEITSP